MKKNFKLFIFTLAVNLLIGNFIIDRKQDSDGLHEHIIYSAVAIAILLIAFLGKRRFRSKLYDLFAAILLSVLVPVLGTAIYAAIVSSSFTAGASLGAVGALLVWQYCLGMAIFNFVALRFYR